MFTDCRMSRIAPSASTGSVPSAQSAPSWCSIVHVLTACDLSSQVDPPGRWQRSVSVIIPIPPVVCLDAAHQDTYLCPDVCSHGRSRLLFDHKSGPRMRRICSAVLPTKSDRVMSTSLPPTQVRDLEPKVDVTGLSGVSHPLGSNHFTSPKHAHVPDSCFKTGRSGSTVIGRNPTTSVNTATTSRYAMRAGITTAAGRRLAVQLIVAKRSEKLFIPVSRHGRPLCLLLVTTSVGPDWVSCTVLRRQSQQTAMWASTLPSEAERLPWPGINSGSKASAKIVCAVEGWRGVQRWNGV